MIVEARLTLGVVILLWLVAPWIYLVNSATDGQWLSDFIFVHHVQRYTHGTGHRQPFYYYFMTLPVDFLPWTVFAIPAAVAYFPYRQLRSGRSQCSFSYASLWFFCSSARPILNVILPVTAFAESGVSRRQLHR